jgi:hypothetical protein
MIFISYKRDPDRPLAQLIQTQLRARGVDTWLDVTFSPGRRWHDLIAEAIAESTDVIVILSNAVVQSEDTYVRNEVEHALYLGKSIVPVTTPDFTWPDVSPSWLDAIRQYHAVAASWDYPEAFAQRLLSFCSAASTKRTLFARLAFWRRQIAA